MGAFQELLIVSLLGTILERIDKMSEALARVQSEVSEQSTVIDSAISLLEGLAAQVRELKDDPAALEALADQLDSNSNKLAASVAANTPAADSEEIPQEDLEPIVDEPGPAPEGSEEA